MPRIFNGLLPPGAKILLPQDKEKLPQQLREFLNLVAITLAKGAESVPERVVHKEDLKDTLRCMAVATQHMNAGREAFKSWYDALPSKPA